jgi:hypothetical protein
MQRLIKMVAWLCLLTMLSSCVAQPWVQRPPPTPVPTPRATTVAARPTAALATAAPATAAPATAVAPTSAPTVAPTRTPLPPTPLPTIPELLGTWRSETAEGPTFLDFHPEGLVGWISIGESITSRIGTYSVQQKRITFAWQPEGGSGWNFSVDDDSLKLNRHDEELHFVRHTSASFALKSLWQDSIEGQPRAWSFDHERSLSILFKQQTHQVAYSQSNRKGQRELRLVVPQQPDRVYHVIRYDPERAILWGANGHIHLHAFENPLLGSWQKLDDAKVIVSFDPFGNYVLQGRSSNTQGTYTYDLAEQTITLREQDADKDDDITFALNGTQLKFHVWNFQRIGSSPLVSAHAPVTTSSSAASSDDGAALLGAALLGAAALFGAAVILGTAGNEPGVLPTMINPPTAIPAPPIPHYSAPIGCSCNAFGQPEGGSTARQCVEYCRQGYYYP